MHCKKSIDLNVCGSVPRLLIFLKDSNEISIDSEQSYIRFRIGSFSLEFLKKSIDSGQSYFRLRIGSFSIEFLKKSIDS